MGLRRARELVVLMAKEFQLYGATWAELKNKSGMARMTFKRGFNLAKERNWLVGGGGRDKPFFLNPDGSWRAAINPDGVGPNIDPEIGTNGPKAVPAWTGDSKIDRIITLASEAIQHANEG
jgi:hypothetical protein